MIVDCRLAEAIAIRRLQADRAEVWVAERIGALASAHDPDGVRRLREISVKLDGLIRGSRH